MQRLEVSGAVRPIYGSLGVKRLINLNKISKETVDIYTTSIIVPLVRPAITAS